MGNFGWNFLDRGNWDLQSRGGKVKLGMFATNLKGLGDFLGRGIWVLQDLD